MVSRGGHVPIKSVWLWGQPCPWWMSIKHLHVEVVPLLHMQQNKTSHPLTRKRGFPSNCPAPGQWCQPPTKETLTPKSSSTLNYVMNGLLSPPLHSAKVCCSSVSLTQSLYSTLRSTLMSGLFQSSSLQPLCPPVQAAVKSKLHRMQPSGHFSRMKIIRSLDAKGKFTPTRLGQALLRVASFHLPAVNIILCFPPPTTPDPFLHLFLLGVTLFIWYLPLCPTKPTLKGCFKVYLETGCLCSSRPFSVSVRTTA